MRPVLLVDFGSTYTKAAAVDMDAESLLGTSSSRTTVESDIGDGLSRAIAALGEKIGRQDYGERYACSSAAGGLRMCVGGLVPELTARAAKQASLGAGAKVIKVYSYRMTDEDIDEINSLRPDIFLLTGGTDGGDTGCMLHNAGMLAGCAADFPVVLAGNRCCAQACERILQGRAVYRCENVMPKLNQLNAEPAKAKIREIFLERIVRAKGLSRISELVSGIVMPTPGAVLGAMQLLAGGCAGETGIGELVGVDVGGATTDVYSVAAGAPNQANTALRGLEEPYAKRTVEGDIGMRHGVCGILDAAGIDRICEISGLSRRRAAELIGEMRRDAGVLPDGHEREALDGALASMAVETAVARHAGTLETVYTPFGPAYLQSGKDLRAVQRLVLTGGALAHAKRIGRIAAHAMYDPAQPAALRPVSADVLVDKNYILAAMGLLGARYPAAALRIMKKEMADCGHTEYQAG